MKINRYLYYIWYYISEPIKECPDFIKTLSDFRLWQWVCVGVLGYNLVVIKNFIIAKWAFVGFIVFYFAHKVKGGKHIEAYRRRYHIIKP